MTFRATTFPPPGNESGLPYARILQLCIVIFGPLIVAWLVFWHLRRGGSPMKRTEVCLLAATWMACSVGMHTLNKSLVMLLQAPSCITLVQMLMAACVMLTFNARQMYETLKKNPQQFRMWLIVPTIFSGMLLSSFFTYKYVTLCVMTVVRNLAPLIALPIECAIMPAERRPMISKESLGAMAIMFAGAVVYSLSAPEVSLIGIVFAVLNMLLAICDRMTQRRLLSQDCKDLSLEICTFLNNFVGMLPTLIVCFATSEVQDTIQLHEVDWLRWEILVLLALSGVVGIGICYCGLAVQRTISATSFLVMQNCSKLAVVSVGIGLFGDPITSQFIVAGLALSLGGSCWYGKSQIVTGSPSGDAEKDKSETLPLMNDEKVKC